MISSRPGRHRVHEAFRVHLPDTKAQSVSPPDLYTLGDMIQVKMGEHPIAERQTVPTVRTKVADSVERGDEKRSRVRNHP